MDLKTHSTALLVFGILLLVLSCGEKKTKEAKTATVESRQPISPYDSLPTDLFLGKVSVETRIEDSEVFTEGPAVDREGMVYFTNVPVNKILKWNPKEKELSVFKKESNGANGLRFTQDGDLLVCEGTTGKVVQISIEKKETIDMATSFQEKALQSPNDLDYDSAGRIYFSSRENEPDLEKENVRGVYRVDPDGSVHQLLAEPQIDMPNGVVVSPDEKTLYVIEAHPDSDHARSILAFDLKDGTISNSRVLYNFYPGRSGDGMSIDIEGNLYVAAGLHTERGTSETLDTRPGIHVISPEGKLLAYARTPEGIVTNCTFGGKDLKTLYVTDGTYLLSIPTKIPGKPSYRPLK
ncbi:SMP-30/gluconolactonase/LRE family protein [Pareuzebyella sediminis]|uniref:SMP-30/gluconolactonase/LRE family protein n=1 Tax=Pareuzebyella sediminis TaxID=2607998 RepID=UPI0011EEE07F|nr:SMP-30/gluconolactonase/LRE family protein [Pareuzebyella sediminis]